MKTMRCRVADNTSGYNSRRTDSLAKQQGEAGYQGAAVFRVRRQSIGTQDFLIHSLSIM